MGKRKTPKTRFDISDFVNSSGQDLSAAVGSLLAPKVPAAQSTPPAGELRPAMNLGNQPAFFIRKLRALSQAGETSFFRLDSDALKLVVDLTAEREMVHSDIRFHAGFQLAEYATGHVATNRWLSDLRLQWGHEFWISLGHNDGPDERNYTTPKKWGLRPGVYLFRSLIEYGRTIVYAPKQEIAIRILEPSSQRHREAFTHR
jgi:hypothetical protein